MFMTIYNENNSIKLEKSTSDLKPLNPTVQEKRFAHQSKGPQHRKSLNIGQAQFHETQAYNDAVKDIPAFLEVVIWV